MFINLSNIYQFLYYVCQFLYYICPTNIIYTLTNINLKLTNTAILQKCLKRIFFKDVSKIRSFCLEARESLGPNSFPRKALISNFPNWRLNDLKWSRTTSFRNSSWALCISQRPIERSGEESSKQRCRSWREICLRKPESSSRV